MVCKATEKWLSISFRQLEWEIERLVRARFKYTDKVKCLSFLRLFSSPLPVFVTLWRGHLILTMMYAVRAHKCCKLQIKRRSFVCVHETGMPWRTYLIQRHLLGHFVLSWLWAVFFFLFFFLHPCNKCADASSRRDCFCFKIGNYVLHLHHCAFRRSFFFEKLKHTAQCSAHCYTHLGKIIVFRSAQACFLLLSVMLLAQMQPIAESNYIVVINVVALLPFSSFLTIVSAFGGFSTIIRSIHIKRTKSSGIRLVLTAHTMNMVCDVGWWCCRLCCCSHCSWQCTLPTYWF